MNKSKYNSAPQRNPKLATLPALPFPLATHFVLCYGVVFMDVNEPPLEFPSDPSASWRPALSKQFSANFEEFFAQTTPLPERPATDETRGKPSAGSFNTTSAKRPAAYLLKSVVAQGGHGEIWQAIQLSLSRRVAVKKVRRKYYDEAGSESLQLLEMAFHKEALVTGRLDHPSIVPIYDIGTDQDGRPLLAMKLVVGAEWTEIINEDSQLDRSAFFAKHLPILISVAQAVAFAHSRAVIHRDLKPSQVMVGEYGEVYLMDWGLAAIFDDFSKAKTDAPTLPYSISSKEAINPAGTTCYMAPEQTESTGERLGPWTDIFLLGGTLYRLLTETPPYNETTSKAAFEKAKLGKVDLPELRAPYLEVPAELSRIAMKALSGNIGQRYGSVQEFIQALQDYLQGTNRRAESIQLTDDARTLFEKDKSYNRLSESDNILSRALNLWPGNTDAFRLQQQLLETFAEAAVAHGDLGLARLQAGRLHNENTRGALSQRIDAEARRLRRLAAQRRLAIAASFFLVIALAALGQFLLHSRASALIRQQRQIAENQKKQHDEQLRKEEAEAARQRAEVAHKTSDLYGAERQLARDLVQEWGPQLIIPPTLVFNPLDDELLKKKDPARLADLKTRLAEVEAARSGLDARTLGSPPFTMAYAAGVMGLYQASADSATTHSEQHLQRASESGSDRYLALAELAIAAFRSGDYNRALTTLDQAGQLCLETVGAISDYRKVLALAHEAGRKQWDRFRLGPDDILIEPRAGGQNYLNYRDTDGWVDTNKPHEWAKSYAPGTTRLPDWGSRAVRFYTGVSNPDTTIPATAYYRPNVKSPRHLYVYATWPYSANAAPVKYVIHHAAGVTTKTLTQDGWAGVLSGNANLWTELGDYDFEPSEDQALELHVDSDVRPVRRNFNGQVVADAVLFSTRALIEATTAPREVSPALNWATSYDDAIKAGKKDNRRLLVYITSPQSSHQVFSDAHVFSDPAIARVLANTFVAVMVSPQGNRPENYRFGGLPTGTMVVCDSNGSELKRISPEKVLNPATLQTELAP